VEETLQQKKNTLSTSRWV